METFLKENKQDSNKGNEFLAFMATKLRIVPSNPIVQDLLETPEGPLYE